MIVSLEEAKNHLRISPTQNNEDSLINLWILAAEEWIEKTLNTTIPGADESPPQIPSSLRSAALLIIGDLYENREGAGEKQIVENPAVMRLIWPYRELEGV